MKSIGFDKIYNNGEVVLETGLYTHVHFPELLVMYDANYIEFKQVPTVGEFKKAATYLRDFHRKRGQKHIKFYLPENEKPTQELIKFFRDEEYDYGFLELYKINPKDFPLLKPNADIEIKEVRTDNLEQYMVLQYEQELEYGEEFAKGKIKIHESNFENASMKQILAYYKGVPAGSVDVILKKETAEIDGLFVKETFRKKGIASHLQKYIMDRYSDKTVILVADGEDTPRDMYQKQNYQYIGYQYEILKQFVD